MFSCVMEPQGTTEDWFLRNYCAASEEKERQHRNNKDEIVVGFRFLGKVLLHISSLRHKLEDQFALRQTLCKFPLFLSDVF